MSGLGHFLEFSVRTPDIIESLNFYKALGFRELTTTDAWPHRYAVVSDGLLHIGLHDREQEAASITFTQPDLAKQALSMSDHGFNFDYMHLDEDVFNEVAIIDSDSHRLHVVEARTFNLDLDNDDDSVLGTLMEISLPVRDTMRAARFWGPVSQVVDQMREEPTLHMRFTTGGISIGLSESLGLQQPSLAFRIRDPDKLSAMIEQLGINHRKYPGYEGARFVIQAPEGTQMFLFDEDFLGETIEVEESDDTDGFPLP